MSPLDDPTDQGSDPKSATNADPITKGHSADNRRSVLSGLIQNIRSIFKDFFSQRASDFKALVLGIIGTFFMGWGGFYYNNRHAPPWIAALLFVLGGVSVAFALRQGIINFENSRPKKSDSTANIWSGIVIVVNVGLAVLGLFFEYRPQLRPHLTLILNTSDSPNANLMFTNHFLFPTHWNPPKKVAWPEKAPFLVVHVPTGKTNVALKFGLLNDCAPQYASVDDASLTVDVPQLELLVFESESTGMSIFGSGPPGKLKWTADSLWRQHPGYGGQVLHCWLPHPILPGLGEAAPTITFDTPSSGSEPVVICAKIRGKGVPNIMLVFKLLFIRSAGVIDPSFVTNNVGFMRIELEPIK